MTDPEMIEQFINRFLQNVTRVDVIVPEGRIGMSRTGAKNVRVLLQDDMRTMKIFMEIEKP